jgi:uncharacterized membrane protein
MNLKQFIQEKIGINLDVRFQNPQYWFMLAIAVITPIVSYLGLNVSDITSWGVLIDMLGQAIMNPYLLVLVIVNVYNATVDGTTRGFKDSQMMLNGEKSNDLMHEREELNERLEELEEEIKQLQNKDIE